MTGCRHTARAHGPNGCLPMYCDCRGFDTHGDGAEAPGRSLGSTGTASAGENVSVAGSAPDGPQNPAQGVSPNGRWTA